MNRFLVQLIATVMCHMVFKNCIQVPYKIGNLVSKVGTKKKIARLALCLGDCRLLHGPANILSMRLVTIVFIAILSLLLVKVWHLLVNVAVALKECSMGTD